MVRKTRGRVAIRSAQRRSRQTRTVSRPLEPSVAPPQTGACGKQDRRKQVSIDIVNARTEEQVLIDELKNLSIGRDAGFRQVVQRSQNEIAPWRIPQGEFTDYEGVCNALEQQTNREIAAPHSITSEPLQSASVRPCRRIS